MRNPVACISCRQSKRQCIYNSQSGPCKRCKDRGEQCLFPPPGTSSIHRQRRGRPSIQGGMHSGSTVAVGKVGLEVSQLHLMRASPTAAGTDLSFVDPFSLFDDEVKNSFLRCSYKWSFYHIPSLLRSIRKKELDTGVIWAILALAIRFSKVAPAPYATPLEASAAFAAHAKSIVLPDIEEPLERGSLKRVQALLMITGHSWGAGEGHRAWMYLGWAIRTAEMMGLFDEDSTSSNASSALTAEERFIEAEEKRRTAWTCFLMDSLLSGGKRRKRQLTAKDMRIQLPCDSNSFHFSEPVRNEKLDGSLSENESLGKISKLDIVAYSMKAADIWGAVARWACSPAVHDELPWEFGSEFQQLLKLLEEWRRSLPHRFQFSINSLHAHSAANQGQAYAYMHSIYFMSVMFLHRSYLSEVETQNKHESDSALDHKYRKWQHESRRELLLFTDQVCEMYEEMRGFGLYFLCGLVPWIGFTVYTAVGIMLYFHHFREEGDNESITRKARDRVVNGCAFLKDMRGSWPMADCWRETIKRMQIFYSNIKTKGEQGVTQVERHEMREAVVDYGALQSSPATSSEPSSQERSPAIITPTTNSPNSHADMAPPNLVEMASSHDATSGMQSQTSILPASQASSLHHQTAGMQPAQWIPQTQVYQPDNMLTDFEIFDTNFTVNDVGMEELISNSTQDFWANFPGEMEMFDAPVYNMPQ